MICRHCRSGHLTNFLDLGHAPPSNAYIEEASLSQPEIFYPLKVNVCNECWLVQTEDFASSAEYFCSDYAYFSSISSSWLNHARKYSKNVIKKLNLDSESFVVELASNDGYLLKNFIEAKIPCLGVEPTLNTAKFAESLGIPVLREFFSEEIANGISKTNGKADLIIANNVFAHVPDINDFSRGMKSLLKSNGTITLEFAHLLRLMQHSQFDTVYHEHFSYLSLGAVRRVLLAAGLKIFHVEELSTHGGSLRIHGCHTEDPHVETVNVNKVLREEIEYGLEEPYAYSTFQSKANEIKNNLLRFLIDAKLNDKLVVGYGAAAKGNTLLNYSGVKHDLLSVIFDAAPSKQNKFAPGSHIPIKDPQQILECRPDYILILPWNISREIITNLKRIVAPETKFVIAVPDLRII